MLDTPGYADFVGDVAAALRAADLAVFVVSAVEGVEVQTEAAWRLAEERSMPRAIFVNKLDRERASFARTLDDLKAKFGAGVAPLELPIGEEAAFRGVVDLLTDEAVTYDEVGQGHRRADPARDGDRGARVHDALVEGIVVADDDLMERYLADEKIAVTELEHALAKGIAEGSVFPVLCGSATKLVGVDRLAHFIAEEGPAPTLPDGPPAAFVFKTIVDPYVGRVNLFKVLQGTVKTDTIARQRPDRHRRAAAPAHDDARQGAGARRPRSPRATSPRSRSWPTRPPATSSAPAARELEVEPLEPPEPTLAIAIRAKSKGDEDKLANALHRLQDEDPAIKVERNAETHQTLLWGMGETHLGIALERLERKFGVQVDTDDVKVAYRETITGVGRGRGQVQEADRRPRAVRDRVRPRRAARARRRASSSTTRSSAARSRGSSSRRSRRASTRRWSRAACSASPSST